MEIIIGDPDRLRAVAQDFIEHYENRVEEGATVAGKAMFVCANRNIAYSFLKLLSNFALNGLKRKSVPTALYSQRKIRKS